jgi:hypothetical protein
MKIIFKSYHFSLLITYIIFTIQPALAENYFKDVVTPTTYVNIYVGKASYPAGYTSEVTDEIGVFVDDGNGGTLLVGACNLGVDGSSDYYRVEIYGDDDPNDGVKKGAYNDDELSFQLYKPTTPTPIINLSTQHFSTETPPNGVNEVTFPLKFVENQMPVVVGYLNYEIDMFIKMANYVSVPCLNTLGLLIFIMIIISFSWMSRSKKMFKVKQLIFIFCILSFLTVPDSYALEHFIIENTPNTWIDYGGKIKIGNRLADPGDEIAVYVQDNQGNEIIVGAAEIKPTFQEYYMVHVFENDSLENEKNGAINGDELIFKFWHKKTNKVYPVLQSYMSIENISGAITPSIPPVFKPGSKETIYGQLNITIPEIRNKNDLNYDGQVDLGDIIFILKGLTKD